MTKLWVTAAAIGLLVTSAAAQNTFPASGNVGIGTTTPSDQLDVVGSIGAIGTGIGVVVVGESGASGKQLLLGVNTTGSGYGTLQSVYENNAYTPLVLNPDGGNIGIATPAPQGLLDVNGPGGVVVSGANLDPRGSYSLVPFQNTGKLLEGWNRSGGAGEIDLISNRGAGASGGFNFYDYSNSGSLTSLLTLQGNGNVGVGGSITFPDASVQATAWNGTLAGADYAESVDVSGDRSKYEPGDVLVIVSGAVRIFRRADSPYSKLVAGVYSTKPGVLGKRETINATQLGEEVPMAMVGIVPTKVSAENGPIEAGDLLVTSSLEGYAMKGTDQTKMLGAVIGKALGALDTGTGMMEVLVTLQ